MGAAETQYSENTDCQDLGTNVSSKISLQEFANLTGFPLNTIKKELLLNDNEDEIELDSLRDIMLSYLNKSFN